MRMARTRSNCARSAAMRTSSAEALPSTEPRPARSKTSPSLRLSADAAALALPPPVSRWLPAFSARPPLALISSMRPPGLPSALVTAASRALPLPSSGPRARSPPAATLMLARSVPVASSWPSRVILPASAASCRASACSTAPEPRVRSPCRLRRLIERPKLPCTGALPAGAGSSAANAAARASQAMALPLSMASVAPWPALARPISRPASSTWPSGADKVTAPPAPLPLALTSSKAAGWSAPAPASTTEPWLALALSWPAGVCRSTPSKVCAVPRKRVREPAAKVMSPRLACRLNRPEGSDSSPPCSTAAAWIVNCAPRPSMRAGRLLAAGTAVIGVAAMGAAAPGDSDSVAPACNKLWAPVSPVRRCAASARPASAARTPLSRSTMSRAASSWLSAAPARRRLPAPRTRSPRVAWICSVPAALAAGGVGVGGGAALLLVSSTWPA